MTNHTPNTVGIDISKAHLDAHQLPSGRSARFANDATGFEALTVWIGSGVERLVYESTGPWHRAFEEALAGTLPLSRVNAKRARRFAQALGQEAKTDAVDARVLARMGAAFDLRQVDLASPTQRDLDETSDSAGRAGEGPHRRFEPQEARTSQAAEASVAEPVGPDRPANQGVGRRGREADRRRQGADAQGRGADLRARNRVGHRWGPALEDAGTGHDRRQGGSQPGRLGADDARVGNLEGAELHPWRFGPGRGACSTWRRSARSATTRTSFASTVNSVNEASRRRWPSRRSCARCWCWPTPCLGMIGSGRRSPSVRRVACRHSDQPERRPPTPGNSRGYQPQLPATSPKHQPRRRAKVRRNTIFATWILVSCVRVRDGRWERTGLAGQAGRRCRE